MVEMSPEAVGQNSGGRHTLGGQSVQTGPPQRVRGGSGGDNRRCDTQGRLLPAPAPKEQMKGVRGRGHLPAPAPKGQMQEVRGGGHLPAPAPQKHMPGGASICQHQRINSTCKECGGAGICQHQRIRSKCNECREEADTSMPADLEVLPGQGI